MSMKKIAFAASAIALAAALAGCTPTQESAAIAGVNAACSVAAVGTTIYVQVEANNGTTPQNISKQVSSDVAADCPVITSAAQAAVTSIVNSGAVASVTVSETAPTVGAKRRVVARASFKAVAGKVVVSQYSVKPDFVLPLIGAL